LKGKRAVHSWLNFQIANMNFVRVVRTNPTGLMPERGTRGSAGLDLFTPTAFTLEAGNIANVDIGISLELPRDTVGRILTKSSHAQLGVLVGGGVIDCECAVKLFFPSLSGEICFLFFHRPFR
jgi:dUTPase